MLPFPEPRYQNASTAFCNETDLLQARLAFDASPTQTHFARVHACELLQTAQDFREALQSHPALATHHQDSSPRVIVFETALYLAGVFGHASRKANAHELEEDRTAILAATLAGLNEMIARIQQQWGGFNPDHYLLSRFFLYPPEEKQATAIFLLLLHASEKRALPLLPFEWEAATWRNEAVQADYQRFVEPLCEQAQTRLMASALPRVATYRDHREN